MIHLNDEPFSIIEEFKLPHTNQNGTYLSFVIPFRKLILCELSKKVNIACDHLDANI